MNCVVYKSLELNYHNRSGEPIMFEYLPSTTLEKFP